MTDRHGPTCVAVINMKGGVGKTTVAALLGRYASMTLELKVLAVDLDPQANLSQAFMGGPRYSRFLNDRSPSIVEIFSGYRPPSPSTTSPGPLAMVSLQFERLPVPVGDEAVVAVAGEEGQLGTGRGLHPPDDEPHRGSVGLTFKGSVGGLGHIGGTVHPVGYGRPIRLGYGLDEIAQAFVLADGDGVADIHLAADGDDGVGIEAAVGPHRELTSGAGVAHPSHRLAQEVGSTPNSVGPALAQPGHQHVPGAGGHGQQRVIAPLAGIAVVSRPLLGQSVSLADGRIQVDGQGRVAGSGTGLPGACQQLAAHPVQLADVAPTEAA